MKFVRALIVLCALCIPVTATAEYVKVQASTFTIEHDDISDYYMPVPEMTMVSDQDGVTVFSLTGLEYLSAHQSGFTSFELFMRVVADPGYIVTRMELSATFIGTLYVQPLPDLPDMHMPHLGEANNYGALGFDSYFESFEDLDGSKTITRTINSPSGFGDYPFTLWGAVSAFQFYGGYWIGDREHRLDALGTIVVENPTFTIYTQLIPVPEPRVWAMLLAGLLPLMLRRFSRSGS